MYFCKNDCDEKKDILVQTTGDKVQNGSYSIEYGSGFVFVSITQLNKSDTGRYRCAVDSPYSPRVYREFNVIVTDGEFPL